MYTVILMVRNGLQYHCFISFFKEVEPKLKYERIANDLTSILSKDAASCIAVHTKVILSDSSSDKSKVKLML